MIEHPRRVAFRGIRVYRWGWYFARPWRFFDIAERFWYELRDFFTRGWYGWARSDCFSLDSYLTDVILPALTYFRHEAFHGSPSTLCDLAADGMPACAYERKGQGCRCCHERFDAILDEMIAGFRAGEELIEHDYYDPKDHEGSVKRGKELEAIQEKGMQAFGKWFNALWQ